MSDKKSEKPHSDAEQKLESEQQQVSEEQKLESEEEKAKSEEEKPKSEGQKQESEPLTPASVHLSKPKSDVREESVKTIKQVPKYVESKASTSSRRRGQRVKPTPVQKKYSFPSISTLIHEPSSGSNNCSGFPRAELKFHEEHFKIVPAEPQTESESLTNISQSLDDLEEILSRSSLSIGVCTCSDPSSVQGNIPTVSITEVDPPVSESLTKRTSSEPSSVSPKLIKRTLDESIDSSRTLETVSDAPGTSREGDASVSTALVAQSIEGVPGTSGVRVAISPGVMASTSSAGEVRLQVLPEPEVAPAEAMRVQLPRASSSRRRSRSRSYEYPGVKPPSEE